MSLYRCWVCTKCSIVSYYPCNYCPNCPGKMEKVVDESNRLRELYGDKTSFIPAEPDSRYKQPWVEKAAKQYKEFCDRLRRWMVNNDYHNCRKGKNFNQEMSKEETDDYQKFVKVVDKARSNENVPMDYIQDAFRDRLKEKGGDYYVDFQSLMNEIKEMFGDKKRE